ncbi:MAG: hypothetical protein H7Z41_17685 [Cytophagales bacterium]|nr:hypothetical protein [Armatimonadota bacterium]
MGSRGVRVDVSAAPGSAPLTQVAVRWKVRLPAGVRLLGDHWERGYGDLEWRGVVPERALPWYVLAHDPPTGSTSGIGVETGAASFASFRADESGVTLLLDIRCGGRGVVLGDRALSAATVHWVDADPAEPVFALAGRLCRTLCPAPRLPAYPVYGGNDWYFRYGRITAETVCQDAATIRELSLSPENAPVFVADAGWFPAAGCDGGPYDHGNAHFPDMPGLAAKLRAQGVRPGIWIRPLLTQPGSVPDTWLLPGKHPLAGAPGAGLDPSVPEVLERVRTDIARLAGWGYEWIKHDFTTYDATGRWGFQMQTSGSVTRDGWSFADRGRTTAEILLKLYRVIREGAGKASLIGCNTVGHLGAGLFELQRTGDDTSGKHWERTRKMGINTLAFRMPQHGMFFAADADCVGLTPAVPWERNRQWLDLLARSGTPLFVSADPAALGPEPRAALTEAFARAAVPTKPAEPLDWLETTCPRLWRFADGETIRYDWTEFAESAFECPP